MRDKERWRAERGLRDFNKIHQLHNEEMQRKTDKMVRMDKIVAGGTFIAAMVMITGSFL